jgi:hypothetical protein
MAAHRFGGIGAGTLAALALALGACASEGGADRGAAEDLEAALDEAADEMAEGTTTTEGPREAERVPVDVELPREATYAHATFAVTEVAYQGAGVDEYGVETDPLAFVGVEVANTGEGAHDMDVTAALFSLLDGDGARIAADYGAVEEATVVVGGRSEFEVAFVLDPQVTEDDLPDFTFQVGEEGRVPAPIPLSGTVPAPAYPVSLTMPAPVGGEMIGGLGTISILAGEVTLDYAGQRAEEGTRFLTVRGDVQSDDGGHRCPGPDDVRISVDGIQVDAAVPRVDLPECFIGGAVSGTWVFVIPATGKAGGLHFGIYSEPGTPSGSFTFPALP